MLNEEEIVNVRRFYEEVLSKGDLAVANEILSTDFLDHGGPPDAPRGIEGVKQLLAMLANVFPDGHITIDDMVAGDGKAAVRLTARGTHSGPLMGFPATGKQVSWTGIDILHISHGKISERWGERDFFGMLMQLGLISPPEV